MLRKRHGYVGHGFAGAIVACSVETRRFCSWVPARRLLRFACFGCSSGAGVFGLGLPALVAPRVHSFLCYRLRLVGGAIWGISTKKPLWRSI